MKKNEVIQHALLGLLTIVAGAFFANQSRTLDKIEDRINSLQHNLAEFKNQYAALHTRLKVMETVYALKETQNANDNSGN